MTLMEVILIIVIFGITLVPMTQLSMGNLKTAARAARLTKGMFRCRGKMDEVILYYRTNGYTLTRTNWMSASGTFIPASDGLSWTVSLSAESVKAGVTYCEATVTVSGTLVPNVVLKTWLS
jgi:hypothetical protein